MIRSLRAGGFSVEMAARAFLVLDSYVYGFVLQETSLPFAVPEEGPRPAETMLEALPDDEYPHLAEMATAHLTGPGLDRTKVFEFGLDLVLDGLEEHRDT